MTARLIFSLLLLLILNSCGVASGFSTRLSDSEPNNQNEENRYAVIVGVDRYRHYSPLDYSVADSNLLADTLRRKGYQVQQLQNFEADPDSVLDTLRRTGDLMKQRGGGGTLIFAFSGHGFQQDGVNYLAMGGAEPARLRQTALSMDRVKNVMKNRVPGKRVLFIDACRNDPTRSGQDRQFNFAEDTDAEGLAILYSTAAGAWSWEDSSIEHGVFSYHVAKAFDNQKIALNNQITFNQLASHVSSSVAAHVYRRFNRVQTPYQAGERSGEFVLASASKGKRVQVPWRALTVAAGALIVGGVLATSGGSDGNSDVSNTDNEDITLVLPTP